MREKIHRLPGGRFGSESRLTLLRTGLSAAWLLGPLAWSVEVRSRMGNARQAERSWARRAARLLDLRLSVAGVENIEPGERYVVVSLHEGFADALALLHLPLRLRFVARDELVEWRVLGHALRNGNHLVIDPEQPVSAYREMLKNGPRILAEESLVLFPQGTILGIETAFQPGAFHLARAMGRPILPVVITGTHRVWEHPFSPLVRFGQRASVQVLPPVAPDRAVREARSIERTMKRIALSTPDPVRHYEPSRDGWWDGYRFEIDPEFPELAVRVEQHRDRLDAAG